MFEQDKKVALDHSGRILDDLQISDIPSGTLVSLQTHADDPDKSKGFCID